MLDPYARAIDGRIDWDDSIFGYPVESEDKDRDLEMDTRDSAAFVHKSVVIDQSFDWGDDRPLNMPLHNSIIYEVHVKGFTAQNPRVDPKLRGTYAGLASPPSIEYLKSLGVTAVELLPGAPLRQRQDAGGQGAEQLLGLQLDRVLRALFGVFKLAGAWASRCASSRRW